VIGLGRDPALHRALAPVVSEKRRVNQRSSLYSTIAADSASAKSPSTGTGARRRD
jgi:hypothetical protein